MPDEDHDIGFLGPNWVSLLAEFVCVMDSSRDTDRTFTHSDG